MTLREYLMSLELVDLGIYLSLLLIILFYLKHKRLSIPQGLTIILSSYGMLVGIQAVVYLQGELFLDCAIDFKQSHYFYFWAGSAAIVYHCFQKIWDVFSLRPIFRFNRQS